MSRLIKSFVASALFISSSIVFAGPPRQLITHNNTDLDSNAFVAGTIPSQHPTHAHTDGQVLWSAVRMACFGHTTGGKCTALIKVGVNTPNPIDVGYLTLDLNTGEITPLYITGNGYSVTVNGPGESTIEKL